MHPAMEPCYDTLEIWLSELYDGSVHGGEKIARQFPVYEAYLPRLKRSIRRFATQLPILSTKCPFCRSSLRTETWHLEGEEYGQDEADQRIGALEACRNCAHWRWHFLDRSIHGSQGLMASHLYRSHAGKLAEFSTQLPEGCAEELAAHLRRNPKLWHSIPARRLETLVAEVIRANYDHVEVTHLGRPRDGGVDVVWVQASGQRWLVQVKGRLHPDAGEPIDTVRNLLGTMVLKDATYGAVVSTADHFSFDAKAAVKDAASRGMTVELFDRSTLEGLIGPLLPKQPWTQLLRTEYQEFLPHFVPPEEPPAVNDLQLSLFTESTGN